LEIGETGISEGQSGLTAFSGKARSAGGGRMAFGSTVLSKALDCRTLFGEWKSMLR
jgi:hypothetical protein